MACVAAASVGDRGVSPPARARGWPQRPGGMWVTGEQPAAGAASRYTVDIWQQNMQSDATGLSPAPSPRTTAVATASLDPLSLEAFLCGPQQQQSQQQQRKHGCVPSITSPLKHHQQHGYNRNSCNSLANSRQQLLPNSVGDCTTQPLHHLHQQQQQHQQQAAVTSTLDPRCSTLNNNKQGESNVMSEVSMMPMSLALKRPADEVHLSDPTALQRNTANLLQSYKKRREDSVGGSDPSSSPHPEDSEFEEETDMPAIDSHQPFPCVWLNSSNGLPLTISPIDPEAKFEVVEPTDPGAAEDSSQDNYSKSDSTPASKEHTKNGDHVTEKPIEITPVSEAHMTNGHYPEEGSEADPAPPTNNGSTPPPISKTASVADSLSHDMMTPTSSQPMTPMTPQSISTMADSMNLSKAMFSIKSETPTPGSPLFNTKMMTGMCLSDMRPQTPENGENLEVCPECHKVFKRKVYLQRHMEREHWSTAKVFKCDDCSYETKHQSNLSVHRRIHTGERPYHCGACGQRYTQGHLLKSHIRSRHGGNMELYNLEKKSDSTRGRKSLDAKHELSPFIKQEKINNLVQQLEQQKLQQMMASPTMSHFMNNRNYINQLRPLMASPLALPNNLMAAGAASPRMQLTNSQNGYNNSMMWLQQSLFMMGNQGLNMNLPGLSPPHTSIPGPNTTAASPTPATASEENGIKLPLKIPDMLTPPNSGGVPANLSFSSNSPQLSTSTVDWQDQNGPQDLTLKKSQASPSSQSSLSSASYQNTITNSMVVNGTSDNAPGTPKTETPPPEDSRDTTSLKRPCEDDNCAHAKKLKLLRKNIVRMLSVLTPDLSMDASLNYDSDQVDELLHEVIYSNMDDIMDDGSRKT